MLPSHGCVNGESPSQRLVEDNERTRDASCEASIHHASSEDAESNVEGHSYKNDGNSPTSASGSSLFKHWMMEGISCLIGIIALGAIIATLLVHDSRPLPDWPLQISVNALVSVFAVIMKIAMLFPVTEAISQLKWSWFQKPRPLSDIVRFDDASRGLWGCTTLLVRLRGMHLASVGALIYLLSTASDPFVQQVVRYVTCDSTVNSEHATIARTNIYNRSGIHMGAMDQSLDIPMQVAIYKGIYNAYTPESAQCSTGNCTFPDYRTLGMCSECRDITPLVQRFKNETLLTTPVRTNTTYDTVFRLPLTDDYEDPLEVYFPYHSQLAVASGANFTDPENIVQTRFLQLDTDAPDFDIKAPNAQGYECTLAPCVRTYKSTVSNGETHEELISEHRASSPRQNPSSPFGIAPMPCLLRGDYFDAPSFPTRNETNWIPIPAALPQNQTAWVPDECWFSITNGVHALRQYLTRFLKGDGVYGTMADVSSQTWVGLVFKSNTSVETLTTTWAHLAESMTIQMRQAGTNITKPATGEVWRTQTCIKVQWAWLAFPIFLLAASIALLAATIVQSHRLTARLIWKSSPLVILFHGLGRSVKERVAHVDDVGEMKSLSKGIYATLYDEGHGIELVERPGPYSTSAVAMAPLGMPGEALQHRRSRS